MSDIKSLASLGFKIADGSAHMNLSRPNPAKGEEQVFFTVTVTDESQWNDYSNCWLPFWDMEFYYSNANGGSVSFKKTLLDLEEVRDIVADLANVEQKLKRSLEILKAINP